MDKAVLKRINRLLKDMMRDPFSGIGKPEPLVGNLSGLSDCLKEEWKGVGKGLGKTFSGLGKTLIRTGKLGLEKADDWAEGREGVDHSAETAAMKEGWTNFGNDFVDSAKGVGKTTVKSVKTGVDSVSNEGNGEAKQ